MKTRSIQASFWLDNKEVTFKVTLTDQYGNDFATPTILLLADGKQTSPNEISIVKK